jgi:SMC interacting uncharacterized protein involved in chromosome segregation
MKTINNDINNIIPEKINILKKTISASSLVNEIKTIYEKWKEADKTYNKNEITNQGIRDKFSYFKEKWENINNDYSDVIEMTAEKIKELKQEVEIVKNKDIKYQNIITISSIYYFLEKENKDKELDSILKKYNISDNIKDLIKNPEKIEQLLQILKSKSLKTPE